MTLETSTGTLQFNYEIQDLDTHRHQCCVDFTAVVTTAQGYLWPQQDSRSIGRTKEDIGLISECRAFAIYGKEGSPENAKLHGRC